MILMDLKINAMYAFNDFHINFSYPQRIKNSVITDETLENRSNFRYKKAVVLLGTNATGKTSLGKAIFAISGFISTGDIAALNEIVLSGKDAYFSIDFVNSDYSLHRINCQFREDNGVKIPDIKYSRAYIRSVDSYESACKRLANVPYSSYAELSKLIGEVKYTFSCPDFKPTAKVSRLDSELALKTLRAVIKTLDPTLADVSIARDLRNSFIIRRNSEEIIVQEGRLLNRESLSSGTAEGVDIAFFLALIMSARDGLYYCDEHFSYIQSDIEKRIFGLMLEYTGRNGQLIFTTHNADMLDLNLPMHCFAFLRKRKEDDYKATVKFASDILKRNTDSIRCAVENDVFSSLPDESPLDELEPEVAYEQ